LIPGAVFVVAGLLTVNGAGQQIARSQQVDNGKPATPVGVSLPAGYVIGSDDVLTIVFWREKDLSADVVVRPDGKISLPLLNDVVAAGYTPEQLRAQLVKTAAKFLEDPNATVVVKEIHSRKVFVTGQVGKSGSYPLTGDMNVLQAIAHAGGLLEYADGKNIVVLRTENGQERNFKFNYKDVVKGKNLQQNILLKPGDTIVVP
jgi:polysaccharide export outer membrane protein